MIEYREACRYLRDVASALALIHTHRLVHRDVSPRNVRLTEDGRVKLITFTGSGDVGWGIRERAPRKNPGAPRRKPRPLRMKELLKAMGDGPLDVSNPILPARWRDRWIAAEAALKEEGLTAFDLTPEELRARWPKRLAAWFEKQLRPGRTR